MYSRIYTTQTPPNSYTHVQKCRHTKTPMDTLTRTKTTLRCLARVRTRPGAPAWYFSRSQSPPLRSSAPAGRRPGSLHLFTLRAVPTQEWGRRERWPPESRGRGVRRLNRGNEGGWSWMPKGTCEKSKNLESSGPPGPGENEAPGYSRSRAAARLCSERALLSAAGLGWGWGRATASSPPQLPSRKSLAPLPRGLEILSNTGCRGSGEDNASHPSPPRTETDTDGGLRARFIAARRWLKTGRRAAWPGAGGSQARQGSRAGNGESGGAAAVPFVHLLAPSSARVFDSIPSEPCAHCHRTPVTYPLSSKKSLLPLSHTVRFRGRLWAPDTWVLVPAGLPVTASNLEVTWVFLSLGVLPL